MKLAFILTPDSYTDAAVAALLSAHPRMALAAPGPLSDPSEAGPFMRGAVTAYQAAGFAAVGFRLPLDSLSGWSAIEPIVRLRDDAAVIHCEAHNPVKLTLMQLLRSFIGGTHNIDPSQFRNSL